MSASTGRTRPTNSTRPQGNLDGDDGGGGFPINIDLGNTDLPENLQQAGDTPFFSTPPQIETNECGQIHPSLAYFCDVDLKSPTSFAEPSYEIDINGCGVCVTMTQNFSATETTSQTYCYVLPACKEPEAPPQEIPIDFDFFDRLINEIAPGCFVTLFFGTHAIHKYYGFILVEASSNRGYSPWFTNNFSTYTDSFGNFSRAQYEFSHFTRRTEDKFVVWHYSFLAMLRVSKQRNGNVIYYEPDQATNGLWPTGPIVSIRDFLNRARFHDNMQAAWGFPKHNWGFEGLQLSCPVGEQYWPLPSPRPYPSPQPRDRDMSCCADVRRLIQMVAMLQQEVAQVKRRTGVDEFPVAVPQSFLADRGNNVVKLQSIPELISWLAKQVDALIGELPGEIEIEDIDPQTEGNQTNKFKFPTLTDLMLEVVGLVINNKINTETVLTAALNSMVEIGTIKTTAVANYHAIQAVLDYLSPQLKQSTVELPLSFAPGETQLHKLFKPTTTKVKIVELDSKTDLQDELADLKKFAAEWRAQNFRKIKLDGTEAQQIKKILKDAAALFSDEDPARRAGSSDNQNQTSQPSDFSNFLEKAERGFTDVNGITDTLNPYGRPFNQRPKIQEIGDTSDRGTEDD